MTNNKQKSEAWEERPGAEKRPHGSLTSASMGQGWGGTHSVQVCECPALPLQTLFDSHRAKSFPPRDFINHGCPIIWRHGRPSTWTAPSEPCFQFSPSCAGSSPVASGLQHMKGFGQQDISRLLQGGWGLHTRMLLSGTQPLAIGRSLSYREWLCGPQLQPAGFPAASQQQLPASRDLLPQPT